MGKIWEEKGEQKERNGIMKKIKKRMKRGGMCSCTKIWSYIKYVITNIVIFTEFRITEPTISGHGFEVVFSVVTPPTLYVQNFHGLSQIYTHFRIFILFLQRIVIDVYFWHFFESVYCQLCAHLYKICSVNQLSQKAFIA